MSNVFVIIKMCYVHNQWYDISWATLYIQILLALAQEWLYRVSQKLLDTVFSIKRLLHLYEVITNICLSFPVFAVLSCCDISEEHATSVFMKLKLLRLTNQPANQKSKWEHPRKSTSFGPYRRFCTSNWPLDREMAASWQHVQRRLCLR